MSRDPDEALHAALDRIALQTSLVRPLPGDTFGFWREESDASLRARIKQALEMKK